MAGARARGRRLEHVRQRGRLRIVRGPRAGIRRDAVRAEAPRAHLLLQEGEGGGQPAVELAAAAVQRAVAALVRVHEEVFGVVEEAHVQGLELEPREGTGELVGQELGVDAVPDALSVLDHLRQRPARRLALLRALQVLSLHVADLRDDDEVFAPPLLRAGHLAQDLAEEALARALRVVGRGVDEVDAAAQRLEERLAVGRRLVVHAIAAESQAAADEARRAERRVAGGGQRRPVGERGRGLRGRRDGQDGRGQTTAGPFS